MTRNLPGSLPAPATFWRGVAAVTAITLLALAFRIFRIDAQGAWLDEAFTIHAAAGGWDTMLGILIGDFNHPPLHTMLVSWWFDLFGVSVLHARVISAIFGTASVPALYWFGQMLFNRRTALLASFLLTISQLGIVYSQEARGYSMWLFLAIVTSGWFLKSFRSGSARAFACFVALASLMLYTHYYSVFALAALLMYALVFRRRSRIPAWWWPVALVAIIVAYLPWLTSGVIQSVLQNPRGAVDDRLFANLLSPLYGLNWFNNGKIAGIRSPTPWWTFPVGCLLFTAPAISALRFLWRGSDDDRQAVSLLLLSWMVPVLGVWALGVLHLVYDVRHVSLAIAPYYLLVARGITLVAPVRPRRALVAAVVAYSALSFRADYFIPYKENYRDAVMVVAAAARPGDCSIFAAPDDNSFARLYWDSHQHPRLPPTLIRLDQASRSDCRRVWLLWDTMWWKAGPQTVNSVLEKLSKTYDHAQNWSFRGVDVHLYNRR